MIAVLVFRKALNVIQPAEAGQSVSYGLLFTAESRTCCAIAGHNLWLEMGFAHRRRRFIMAKPVTITAQKAVNSNSYGKNKK